MPGARGHRIVDGDDRQRADRLPRCFTTFISEIFSSSGQPASVTPKTLP
jgi:hypothetical protein